MKTRKTLGRRSVEKATKAEPPVRVEGGIRGLLADVEKQLRSEDFKPSMGDYLRLVQMVKELDEKEEIRDIEFTWVDRKTEPK